jgi:hypothetical protein
MTLTREDKETIGEALKIAMGISTWMPDRVKIEKAIAILDRLAEEENADPKDGSRKALKAAGKHFETMTNEEYLELYKEAGGDGPAAPSSPLPDAICARCGKRYDEHYRAARYCWESAFEKDGTFLPTPDKPQQDDVEPFYRCRTAWLADIEEAEARTMAEIEGRMK